MLQTTLVCRDFGSEQAYTIKREREGVSLIDVCWSGKCYFE